MSNYAPGAISNALLEELFPDTTSIDLKQYNKRLDVPIGSLMAQGEAVSNKKTNSTTMPSEPKKKKAGPAPVSTESKKKKRTPATKSVKPAKKEKRKQAEWPTGEHAALFRFARAYKKKMSEDKVITRAKLAKFMFEQMKGKGYGRTLKAIYARLYEHNEKGTRIVTHKGDKIDGITEDQGGYDQFWKAKKRGSGDEEGQEKPRKKRRTATKKGAAVAAE